MKILVLCHGNINRSAACAAVLRKRFHKHEVRSAGFVNPGGKRAAKKMREAMAKHGYSLEEHRSETVTVQDVLWADKVILMDTANLKRFINGGFHTRIDKENVHLLGEWARPKQLRIPDPNYMKRGPKFDAIVKLIIDATLLMGKQLKREL